MRVQHDVCLGVARRESATRQHVPGVVDAGLDTPGLERLAEKIAHRADGLVGGMLDGTLEKRDGVERVVAVWSGGGTTVRHGSIGGSTATSPSNSCSTGPASVGRPRSLKLTRRWPPGG